MLPAYVSSAVPSYSPQPSLEEETLAYTPRYPGVRTRYHGNFVQKWKHATIILKDQDEKEPLPCYGRNSVIHGELGLSTSQVASVVIKFEGRLTLSVSDVGSSASTLVQEKYTVWKRDADQPVECPSMLPFSIRIPTTFVDGNSSTRKLPPTYEAMFSGIPSLWVTSVYSLQIIINRTRPRYGLWKPDHRYTLRLNYRPRSRPNRPIARCDSIFSMVKYMPEEWHQIMATMESRSSSSEAEPINCHFLIPSVQTYGLEDTIPFHIQLVGPLESLAHLFPERPRIQTEEQKLVIRVCLVRKTLVWVNGKKFWRNRSVGEGKVWPTPPPLASSCGHHAGEVSADWEGEIQCDPDVRTSSFNIGNVAVQDFMVFALTPTNARSSLDS